MRAFPRGVRDGRNRATTADAPVTALEAHTRHEFFGQLVHLGETDGAGEGEASVTQGLTGSVQKQTARGLHRGHPPALLGWCCNIRQRGSAFREPAKNEGPSPCTSERLSSSS